MRGKPFFNQTELAIEIHYKPKKEKFNFSGNILKNPVKIWRKSESWTRILEHENELVFFREMNERTWKTPYYEDKDFLNS